MKAFQAVICNSAIPDSHQEAVVAIVRMLAEKASPDQVVRLARALFQLRTMRADRAVTAVAELLVAVNRRLPQQTLMDELYLIQCPSLPKEALPIAAALAVELLRSRGQVVTDGFRQPALHWFRDYNLVPDFAKAFVEAQIRIAWTGAGTTSPIEYWKRAPAFFKVNPTSPTERDLCDFGGV